MILTATLMYLNSCKKQNSTEASNVLALNDESSKITQHILDFKERMKYYKNNPGIKVSRLSYTADSATLELESLLNYDFCYANIDCNKKVFTSSVVIMPLDILNRINDPDLMQVYYDKVIDTIQAQMGRTNFTNMKLLLVDLEVGGYDSSVDAIISVGSLIGNQQNIVLHNDSWMYGEELGLCGTGGLAPEDAASQLGKRVIDNVLPEPPSGGRWYFTNMVNAYIQPTSNPLTNTPNNYRDYKIFYATDAVTPTIDNDTKCLSSSDMDFYEYYYIEYAEDLEISTNKLFANCWIEGKPYWISYIYNIQHDYTIFVGNRFVVYDAGCDDIMAVD